MNSAVTCNARGNKLGACGNLIEIILRLCNVNALGGGLVFVCYYRLAKYGIVRRGLKNKSCFVIEVSLILNSYGRTSEERCIVAKRYEVASRRGGVSEVGIVKLDFGVICIYVKESRACGRNSEIGRASCRERVCLSV